MRAKDIFHAIFLVLCLVLFSSCKDKKNELYGISIDASRMVGTPAEVFSLQHVEMFQASNSFIINLLPQLYQDSTENSFAFAPFYALSYMALDTNLNDYFVQYNSYYKLSEHSSSKARQSLHSFLEGIYSIDSTINVQTELEYTHNDSLLLRQGFKIILHYNNDIQTKDNTLFVGENAQERKEEFLKVAGEFNVLESKHEVICDIPVGNGNFVLSFIKPQNMSLREYISQFDEKHYINMLREMENRRTNISFPLINIEFENLPLAMPQIPNSNALGVFPKALSLSNSFHIENIPFNASSSETLLQNKNTEPINFNSPFVFILRERNSNLIVYIGYYL
mgnify:CR=1 FL=1